MNISEKQREVAEEFSLFPDWREKYERLIELGKSLPGISEAEKRDSLLIAGCQSRVWLKPEFKQGKLYFKGDSDAMIPKGIIGLLIRIFSGHEPREIAQADTGFLDTVGLQQFLSPTRSNGLSAMVKQMKFYALAWQAKDQQA